MQKNNNDIYVSFEEAKQLAEKGFNLEVTARYREINTLGYNYKLSLDKNIPEGNYNFISCAWCYSAPTKEEAEKWLQENK